MSEHIVNFPGAYVIGIETDTSHSIEAARDTSRIATLWQKFYQEGVEERVPNRREPAELYEIYHRYNGERYSVLIGVATGTLDDVLDGLHGIHIKEGKYRHYAVAGEMPKAIQDAWKSIRAEYAGADAKRAFTSDFEVLKRSGDGNVVSADIYVALQ